MLHIKKIMKISLVAFAEKQQDRGTNKIQGYLHQGGRPSAEVLLKTTVL